MFLQSSCTTRAKNMTNPITTSRPQIRYVDSDRSRPNSQWDPQSLETLSVTQLKDLEFAAADLSKRWYLAHQWWRLFWNSQERLDGESMLAKIYRRGHPRYGMFKRFAGAEVLLSWLCTSGINPDQVQRSQLEFFVVHIYPSHPDFIDSNTVADLVEFSCVCEFLKRIGAAFADDFSTLFGEGVVTTVLERRAAIHQLSRKKIHRSAAESISAASTEIKTKQKTTV